MNIFKHRSHHETLMLKALLLPSFSLEVKIFTIAHKFWHYFSILLRLCPPYLALTNSSSLLCFRHDSCTHSGPSMNCPLCENTFTLDIHTALLLISFRPLLKWCLFRKAFLTTFDKSILPNFNSPLHFCDLFSVVLLYRLLIYVWSSYHNQNINYMKIEILAHYINC